MTLNLALNPSSGEPVYQQIINQVERLVATGALAPDSTLPSVRQLASTLTVNPMTVSKAYSQLEQLGVVVRQPGVGMRVLPPSKPPTDLLRTQTETLIKKAQDLNLDLPTLLASIEAAWLELEPTEENHAQRN